MFNCNFANFYVFLKEYESKFQNCKYPFYKNKCIKIVSDIFHSQEIKDINIQFLEKQSGYSVTEWENFIAEFRHEAEDTFEEYPMDPYNMPFAP